MPLALSNNTIFALNRVNQAMTIINPAAPEAGKILPERFGFFCTRKWMPLCVFDKLVNALQLTPRGQCGSEPLDPAWASRMHLMIPQG